MSIAVSPFCKIPSGRITSLRNQLISYYKAPPTSYYEIADRPPEDYSWARQPFHCDLVTRIQPGMRVLELGCGTAHLCSYVQMKGASYTGVDYSEQLLRNNKIRFPAAEFIQIGSAIPGTFDLVASLYTLEHVVDPPAYLCQLWDCCKVGGLIAIICPEFIDSDTLPPSFYYGTTSRRIREKITTLSFEDVLKHIWDLTVTAPRWKKKARAADPGRFWINLCPRMLHGARYTIDCDAVHLTRLTDISHWLSRSGAAVVQLSTGMKDVPREVSAYNCYIVARKESSRGYSER